MLSEDGILDIPTARAFLPLIPPKRHKFAKGGRASAKSHFFGGSLIERCLYTPTRALCIREHQTTLRNSVKQLLEDKIKAYGVEHKFRCLNNSIEGPNNSLINFIGMKNHTAESVKSFESYNIAWLEEAQSISQHSLDILLPTIRADASEIWASWNTRHKKDPIDKFAEANKKDTKHFSYIQVTWRDNPWLSKVSLQDIIRDSKRDRDRYLHIWEGHYDKKSGRKVFKNYRVGELNEFDPDAMGPCEETYGADFGFSNDPSGIVRLKVNRKKRIIYVMDEWFGYNVEIVHLAKHFLSVYPNPQSVPCTADSARPETISHLKKNGLPLIRAAKKGPNSVLEGVEFIRNYDVIIHPKCQTTLDEFDGYAWKVDEKTDEVLSELEDEDNHAIDSVRYALEHIRRPQAGW